MQEHVGDALLHMTRGDGKKGDVAGGGLGSGSGSLKPYLGPFTSLIIEPIDQWRCNQTQRPLKGLRSL